jgi:hypothetical protein
VVLFSAMGGYWSISGDHSRSIVLAPAVAATLDGWTPPPGLLDRTRVALCIALLNSMIIVSAAETETLVRLLTALGPGTTNSRVRALVTVLLATASLAGDQCEALAADPDPLTRGIMLQWLSHNRENAGDPVGAIEAASAALDLIGEADGPWHRAMLHTQLFGLYEHVGDTASASRHAAEALPVLDRLGAVDDSHQIRAVLTTVALIEGRRDDAARMIDDLEAFSSRTTHGEILSVVAGRAQLALIDGDIATGLRLHREAAEAWEKLRFPGVPDADTLWAIPGEAMALSAFAQYSEGDDGVDLFESLRANARDLFGTEHPFRDFPLAGMALAGLGIWGLLKGAMPAEEAIRLLVLADRFAYNRFTPTMQWPVLCAHAERAVPGVLSRIEAEYGEQRGPDLLAEASAVLQRVT